MESNHRDDVLHVIKISHTDYVKRPYVGFACFFLFIHKENYNASV